MVLSRVTRVAAGASGSQQAAPAGPADRQQEAEEPPPTDSGGAATSTAGAGADISSRLPPAGDFGAALQRARRALGVADDRWVGMLSVSPDMTVTEAFQRANTVAHK